VREGSEKKYVFYDDCKFLLLFQLHVNKRGLKENGKILENGGEDFGETSSERILKSPPPLIKLEIL
jgi:hypothetical protein